MYEFLNNSHIYLKNQLDKVIYAWAMNAPALLLPQGVAFKLAAGDAIVLEVHYNSVDKFKHGYEIFEIV